MSATMPLHGLVERGAGPTQLQNGVRRFALALNGGARPLAALLAGTRARTTTGGRRRR